MVTENDIKRICLDWLRANGWLAIRVNNGAAVGEHNGKRRFIKFTDTPGSSDILACSPNGGRFAAIECKRPGKRGNTSPAQEQFLADVRERGGVALVVESLDDLIAGIAAIPREFL